MSRTCEYWIMGAVVAFVLLLGIASAIGTRIEMEQIAKPPTDEMRVAMALLRFQQKRIDQGLSVISILENDLDVLYRRGLYKRSKGDTRGRLHSKRRV